MTLEEIRYIFDHIDDTSFWIGYAAGAGVAALIVIGIPLLRRLWRRVMW